jgi:hypothetical protein
MLDPNTEIALHDISRRIVLLMTQVGNGDPVDTDLLIQLKELSEEYYIKHIAGYQITETEVQKMTELISLLEMRTTLIYKNPPDM